MQNRYQTWKYSGNKMRITVARNNIDNRDLPVFKELLSLCKRDNALHYVFCLACTYNFNSLAPRVLEVFNGIDCN